MSAFLVLLLAIASRVIPHAVFHEVSWNFTLLGGSLLFFGSRMASGAPRLAAAKLAAALLALIATDYYLTVYAYGYGFHISPAYLVSWLWYAAICLLGMGLLQKPTALRVAAGAIATPTSFFLISNFAVWMGHAYPHTVSGLATCYTLALPFYRNDLVSTAITAGALFGLPALAGRIAESFRTAHDNNLVL